MEHAEEKKREDRTRRKEEERRTRRIAEEKREREDDEVTGFRRRTLQTRSGNTDKEQNGQRRRGTGRRGEARKEKGKDMNGPPGKAKLGLDRGRDRKRQPTQQKHDIGCTPYAIHHHVPSTLVVVVGCSMCVCVFVFFSCLRGVPSLGVGPTSCRPSA